MQTAFWNFLGLRGVDAWIFDLFGQRWAEDIQQHLKIADVRVFEGEEGALPDFGQADWSRDQVFVWAGTTSGLWLQHKKWIPDVRDGLTFCDATSAVLCADLPWSKLDVTAFSWQKGLGGEAGVGMLALSPKAMEQLRNFEPSWPIPRTMRLRLGRKLHTSLFHDSIPLNTLSMLSVADVMYSLTWMEGEGGLPQMLRRVAQNNRVLQDWVGGSNDVAYAVEEPLARSASAVCIRVTHPAFAEGSVHERQTRFRLLATLLERERVGFDLLGHPAMQPMLRLWCGPTVEEEDLARLLPWVSWGIQQVARMDASVLTQTLVDFARHSSYKERTVGTHAQEAKHVAGVV
jgi:phosphoserine aminotransferase